SSKVSHRTRTVGIISTAGAVGWTNLRYYRTDVAGVSRTRMCYPFRVDPALEVVAYRRGDFGRPDNVTHLPHSRGERGVTCVEAHALHLPLQARRDDEDGPWGDPVRHRIVRDSPCLERHGAGSDLASTDVQSRGRVHAVAGRGR